MSKTVKIKDIAKIVRSKNAGPFLFTFDIIFANSADYEKVRDSGVIDSDLIVKLYNLPKDYEVSIFTLDPANAIKITIPRPIASGGVGDSDVCGAQQHVPLYDIEIPVN
jgi:hypothetical protein